MKTTEVEIAGRTIIDLQFENEDITVDEVVVTALGISRDKKALGYSVSTVNSDEIAKSNNADLVNALSARTTGVNVNSSAGTAGASAYITIRGSSSLTRNNQPLFVVDGAPVASGGGGGAVDGVATSGRSVDINPEDIETMTILKGGAATALYGIQAANGVVLITTKKGKKGKNFQVDFTSSLGISQISQVPEMQKKYAQGAGGVWISGRNDAWGPDMSTLVYSKDPAVWTRPLMDVYGALVDANSIDPSSEYYAGTVSPFDQYDFFQTGIASDINIGVRSSSEKSSYYFSIGNRTEKGVVPNNTFGRTSVRLNSETVLNKWITTGSNMAFVNSRGNFIQQGSNTSGVMLGLLRTPPSFDNGAGYKLEDGSQRTYRGGGGYDNPYWVANEIYWKENVNRYIGNAYINITATDWLTFNYKVGLDWYNRQYQDVMAVGSAASTDGYTNDYMNSNQIINSDLLANINKTFGNDLNLRATLGQNLYQETFKYVYGAATGLSIPAFYDVSNTSAQTTDTYTQKIRTAALFYDINLGWKNMIYVGTTGRYEWATTMPDGKAYFYPSANFGFIFTELEPLKGKSILSFGKLRASYAITANIADPYSTVTTYAQAGAGDGWTTGIAFPFNGYTGFTKNYLMGNPNLKHEIKKTYEFGAELHFLNDRVTMDLGYFKNRNEDLLMEVPVANSSGFSNNYMNVGVMESYGWEVQLGGVPIKINDFAWEIILNWTKVKNPVISLAEGVDNLFLGGFTDPQIRAVAGEEYKSIYGYDYYRDSNGNLLINDDPTDGYPDGFPMTNGTEMISLGTVNPDWTGNISNTFTYKGIRLSALIDIKHGGKMYNGTRFTMNSFGTSIETIHRDVVYNPDGSINLEQTPAENLVLWQGVLGHLDDDRNVVSNGETNNIYVVNGEDWFEGQGGNFGGGPTTAAIENAGWVRLREITLGYTLDKNVLKKLPLTSVEIYFTGRNLWLNTPYRGIDPETSLLGATNGQGMDYFNMPGTKTFTFGLKIGL